MGWPKGKPRKFSQDEIASWEGEQIPHTVDAPEPAPEVGVKHGDVFRHAVEPDLYRLITAETPEKVWLTRSTIAGLRHMRSWEDANAVAIAVDREDWLGQVRGGHWVFVENMAHKWES